ncbi:MAG: hypothetical protein NT130_04755 [Candidatus Micrarchaeota archaeon]|nr:hypothetical protein [Candidatus Micrarchaeota archaeon]
MKNNFRVLLGFIALVALFIVLYWLPNFIQETNPTQCTVNGQCEHEARMNLLMYLSPVFVAIGFVLGAVAFYFFTENKKVEYVEVKPSPEAILKLLPADERKVVAKIAEEGGKALQSEISLLDKMGKVKSHRIIDRLEERGIVEKEQHGKTNLVKLTKELKDALVK